MSARSLKSHTSELHDIFCTYFPCQAVAQSSDDNEIRYVLPVLWMTSCFRIMGHMARDVDNGLVMWAPCWSEQVAKISNDAALFDFDFVYNGTPVVEREGHCLVNL